MTYESFIAALQDTDVNLPLACSVLAGAVIGAEREMKGKPAGLRTHTLVCFASALLTLLGLRMGEWVVHLPEGAQVVSDMARMPHAILTGVGFLGAGVIFRAGVTVQGLTTAATLWLTAALGVVFGTGLMELGLIGAIVALLVLLALRLLQRLSPPRPSAKLEVEMEEASALSPDQMQALIAAEGLTPGPLSLRLEGGRLSYSLVVSSQKGMVHAPRLLQRLRQEPAVLAVALAQIDGELVGDS